MRLSSVPPGITCDAGSAVRVQGKGSRILLKVIFRSRAIGMISFSDTTVSRELGLWVPHSTEVHLTHNRRKVTRPR